ncbi:hypothetical protein Dimus_031194 [Dionaea muscipula]
MEELEDCNTLIADCVVICCCCQCLVLQVAVLFFLELPYKMARRTREYARRRKLRHKREGKPSRDDLISLRTEMEELFEGGEEGKCCIDEVEKVMEELVLRGEFAFGSFWRRDGTTDENGFSTSSSNFQLQLCTFSCSLSN